MQSKLFYYYKITEMTRIGILVDILFVKFPDIIYPIQKVKQNIPLKKRRRMLIYVVSCFQWALCVHSFRAEMGTNTFRARFITSGLSFGLVTCDGCIMIRRFVYNYVRLLQEKLQGTESERGNITDPFLQPKKFVKIRVINL